MLVSGNCRCFSPFPMDLKHGASSRAGLPLAEVSWMRSWTSWVNPHQLLRQGPDWANYNYRVVKGGGSKGRGFPNLP